MLGGRDIPPITVDGATLFVARNGEQIEEFLYTDIEQAYQTTDLALVSRHILPTPIDQDFDQKRRLLFVVREDGKLAALTLFRAEQVAAWTLHETLGRALAVSVEIGLAYTHIIEPLPPSVVDNGGAGRAVRLVEGIFRLEDTAALRLDVGRGLKDVSLRQIGEEAILDAPAPLTSGDIRVHALGWQADGMRPLWRIEQDAPLPFYVTVGDDRAEGE